MLRIMLPVILLNREVMRKPKLFKDAFLSSSSRISYSIIPSCSQRNSESMIPITFCSNMSKKEATLELLDSEPLVYLMINKLPYYYP